MRTTISLFLLSVVFATPVASAATPNLRTILQQKDLIEYCTLIKLSLKKAQSVTPGEENQSKFDLSIDMMTKASALCDAMLSTQTSSSSSVTLPQNQGFAGYCLLVKAALKKGESVTPSADNQSKFALSIDMLTKASALCDAMQATPAPVPPQEQGLSLYCGLIKAALKMSGLVTPSAANVDQFNLTVDFITKAAAICDSMQASPR